MANQRIYLKHSSGAGIKLGKRMAGTYYAAPTQKELEAFFDSLPDEDLDGFTIGFEMDSNWENDANG